MALTYKCSGCGSAMVFNIEKNSLYCEHCQTVKDVEKIDNRGPAESIRQQKKEGVMLRHYHCESCSAEIMVEEHTIASFCSFCGSPSLLMDKISAELKPSRIIPFKVTKDQAVNMFHKWARSSHLVPGDFISSNTIEKITGIYVPFWLYDFGADVEIEANCTKTQVSRKGNTEYTYTNHYVVSRRICGEYEKIPADASEKMDDITMQKIEPYDYSGLENFKMPYLSGFFAEKYNFNSQQLVEIAKRRVAEHAIAVCRDTIRGYGQVKVTRQEVRLNEREAEYVLMPVWVLHYRYKSKDYHLFLNGQTGKLVGDCPISYIKVAGWFIAVALLTYLILTMIGGLL